jgi:CRISPR/Cas system-associated exonuclease Cas4 (RecB family)
MKMENGKFKFWDFDKRVHYFTDFVEQMSATDIKNAKVCEYKLYHKLTQRVKPPKNVYLIMGSIFHSVIEQDLRYKAGRGVNKKLEDLIAFFNGEWKKQTEGMKDFGKFTELQAKTKCLDYIKIYSIKMSPMLYPINLQGIERFFRVYVSFGEKKLGISGKVDLIDRSLWITDHKTSSSAWSQSDADKEVQAQLYPYCIKSLGYDVQGFKFNVVCDDTVNVFPVAYDQKKVKELLTDAFDIKKHIEEENMLRCKSEKVCKWCEYSGVCEESLLQKSEDL